MTVSATTQYITKVVLGFVALGLYLTSVPFNGGAPIFAFSATFQAVLIAAVVGSFGWAATQGSVAVAFRQTALSK